VKDKTGFASAIAEIGIINDASAQLAHPAECDVGVETGDAAGVYKRVFSASCHF